MTEPDPQPAPLPDRAAPAAMRASDADRERVVEILRGAGGDGRLDADELEQRVSAAYSSRTLAELETLTVDLLAERPRAQAATAARGEDTTLIISIMGTNERRGHWWVPRRMGVVNLMGGSEIDLSAAELSGPETTIRVFSVMGGCRLRVPHGVEVQVTKVGIMGGHDVRLDRDVPAPGAPVIRLKLFALMGGGEVRQGPNPRDRDALAERRLRP